MAARAGRDAASRPGPLRVALVTMPTSEAIDIVGTLDILFLANNALRSAGGRGLGYAVEIVAAAPGAISRWVGLDLVARRPYHALRGPIDTLIIGSVDDPTPLTRNARLVAWVRRTAPRARRIVGLCTGAFLLAEARVLEGRRATTHWTFCEELARRYPRVNVDREPIFIQDRNIYTSAGSTASMDLVLALVEEDFGRRVALAVATSLVLFLKRPAGQAQFSAQLSTQLAERQPLRDLQAWMIDHPGDDLSVPALARRVAMSARNFFRVFTREIGMTPAQFVQRTRVEAARRMLEDTRRSADEIAHRCGFGTAETMRAAFQRLVGMSPQTYRARLLPSADGHRRRPVGAAFQERPTGHAPR
jgi:transcriptional regulator GlxA family with amidase domain